MVVMVVVVMVMMIVMMVMVMIRRAIRRAGVGHRLVHELLDGACAPPALPAATETAIDFAGGERLLGRRNHATDIVVSQDIA
jgi:hypothetical protein